ncbi:neuropeptide FF receptor 1-like [Branchiostoma lanceolatum]|uniref:neuropeptide FF receptor 1-like n=1 Tax=Branchiostoma lanceolatum TaxID=7740 RepID=UPI003453B5B9
MNATLSPTPSHINYTSFLVGNATASPTRPCGGQADLNFNHSDWTQVEGVRILFIVLYIIVMLLGMCGNAFVCWTIRRNRLLHNAAHYFIANLAVSDLLVSSVVVPLTLVTFAGDPALLSRPLCTIANYMQPVCVSASVFTLVAISLERFYAIVQPLRNLANSRIFPVNRVRNTIIAIWLVPMVVLSPWLVPAEVSVACFYSDLGQLNRARCLDGFYLVFDPVTAGKFHMAVQTITLLVMHTVPMLFIAVTCGLVLWRLMKLQKPVAPRGTVTRSEINRRKVTLMVVAVVVAFVVAWTPLHMVSITYLFTPQPSEFVLARNNFFTGYLILYLLGYLNSLVNPLIYILMSDRFRRDFKVIVKTLLPCLSWCRGCDGSSGGRVRSNTAGSVTEVTEVAAGWQPPNYMELRNGRYVPAISRGFYTQANPIPGALESVNSTGEGKPNGLASNGMDKSIAITQCSRKYVPISTSEHVSHLGSSYLTLAEYLAESMARSRSDSDDLVSAEAEAFMNEKSVECSASDSTHLMTSTYLSTDGPTRKRLSSGFDEVLLPPPPKYPLRKSGSLASLRSLLDRFGKRNHSQSASSSVGLGLLQLVEAEGDTDSPVPSSDEEGETPYNSAFFDNPEELPVDSQWPSTSHLSHQVGDRTAEEERYSRYPASEPADSTLGASPDFCRRQERTESVPSDEGIGLGYDQSSDEDDWGNDLEDFAERFGPYEFDPRLKPALPNPGFPRYFRTKSTSLTASVDV